MLENHPDTERKYFNKIQHYHIKKKKTCKQLGSHVYL